MVGSFGMFRVNKAVGRTAPQIAASTSPVALVTKPCLDRRGQSQKHRKGRRSHAVVVHLSADCGRRGGVDQRAVVLGVRTR